VRELVRTNTVAAPPGGRETPGQLVLQSFLETQGVPTQLYSTRFIERSGHPAVRPTRAYRGRKNLSARLAGSGSGQSLLLNGHMDTVPAIQSEWSGSPWSGRVESGKSASGEAATQRIHGLGSFDMKGGLAAIAAVLCAFSRAGIRPAGDLRFESVVDEEWGGGGGTIAARLHDDARYGRPDACIIPEGTQLEIYRATRGGFTVDLSVDAGDPAAYFSRTEVLSPAIPVGRLLGWVDSLAHRRASLRSQGAYAQFPDPVPVQVLAIQSGGLDAGTPLTVPSRATVRVYLQFLPEEDVDAVLTGIRLELQVFADADPFFSRHAIQWQPLLGAPLYGQQLAEDHPLTRCLAQSAAAVLGRPPVVTAAPYPCDAGLMQRTFGIPTLLFGPAGAGAHNAGEYVEFSSVLRAAETLLAAALAWTC
jgi:acetylornithine deacetylase